MYQRYNNIQKRVNTTQKQIQFLALWASIATYIEGWHIAWFALRTFWPWLLSGDKIGILFVKTIGREGSGGWPVDGINNWDQQYWLSIWELISLLRIPNFNKLIFKNYSILDDVWTDLYWGEHIIFFPSQN